MAVQALPFSTWGDVAGAKLDPDEVPKARKVQFGYAEKKPVWVKIPRRVAKTGMGDNKKPVDRSE